MNKVEQRRSRLVDILKEHSYVSIRELAGRLGVSEMTIRRDIRQLQAENLASNYGGRMVYNPWPGDPFDERSYDLLDAAGQQMAEKERIGRYAAQMVAQGDSIAVDTGTTTERVVPFLPTDKDLTVLCYNVNILVELRRNPGVSLLFGGGYYHPGTQMFTSAQGLAFIQGFRTQKAFVSAAGVHGQLGVTCANGYEVPTKKAILEHTLQKILVADSSKFGQVRSAYFCELAALDDIVTDTGLSQEWRETIEALGINLHLV